MNVTSTAQAEYAQATNKSSSKQENEQHKILTVEELLDEEAYSEFNKLISGMSEEDKTRIQLVLSFQLSIKSEDIVDGKLQIQRETGELDNQAMLEKLNLLIAKRRDRMVIDPAFEQKLDSIVDSLKVYYENREEASTNMLNKEDSVVDDFLTDLYSNDSINFKSSVIKEKIDDKVNQVIMQENTQKISSLEILLATTTK